MADLNTARDEQDQSEVFDEDNTNANFDGAGEDAETFEDLVDVYDATAATGDADADEPEIGDNLDDDQIVAYGRDDDDAGDDLEGGDDPRRDEIDFELEADPTDSVAQDDVDGVGARQPDEVELEYVGDLSDLAGAASAAQTLESAALSDRDLRELDYKDEFTLDEAD
jgi:hypothetical protein